MEGPGEPTPAAPSLEKIIAGVASFLLSLVPGGSLLAGFHLLQLYVPTVYHGQEVFLIVPVVVAAAAISLVVTRPWGWLWVFFGFLILAVVVWVIYRSFPADSAWHFWNWVLWNCVIALGVAILLHLYLFARRLAP